MKLILLKDHASRPKTFSIGKIFITTIVMLFITFSGLMVFAGMQISEAGQGAVVQYENSIPHKLNQNIVAEKEKLETLRVYLENNLVALSARLGGLQAQVSRINAVEKRLASAAKIDMSAFDFENEPALGGSEDLAINITPGSLSDDILTMEGMLAEREVAIRALGVSLSEMILKEGQTPKGMPVKRGWISSRFGWRTNPVSGRKQFHKGIDIPAKTGEDIIAVANGVVVVSEKQSALGNVIEINHGDGMRTIYAHNSKNIVTVGTAVSKGDKIAEVGSTGRSTGPHVHFQVNKDGKAINPKPFIR